MEVIPDISHLNNYYTFVLDQWNRDYHYSNIPGSYIWNMETNELKHITYMGTTMESAWVGFTDDFKYFIEDSGTGPGPRGLGVYRLSDRKNVFSGNYLKDINLHDNYIEIIYRINRWTIENNSLDNEILYYSEKFKQENSVPEEMLANNHSIELIIFCEINLDTGVRKILRGQYRNDY